MTALILKDIAALKKTLISTLAICLAIAFYGVYENQILIIPLICAMMPLILTAIAFGYDTNSKFEQFAFSMPVKRSSFVISKLFFAFAFGVLGAITVLILLITKGEVKLENIILISIFTFISSVLMSAIQLPFMLKFGAEKSRLIMVITYFAIFTISSLLKNVSGIFMKIMGLFRNISPFAVYPGLILAGLAIIVIAIRISIRIMVKKEY